MWKKIAAWTGVGIISLLCLLLISVLLGRGDILGYRTYCIASSSMSPALDAGDVIYVTDGDAQVGDVVVLNVDGNLTTHRLIGAENGRIVTKGDANESPDTFEDAAIVGVVRFHIPYLGRLALSVRASLVDSDAQSMTLRATVWETSSTSEAAVLGQDAPPDLGAPPAEDGSGTPTTQPTTTTTTAETTTPAE